MSRGLGSMQWMLLRRMVAYEVQQAELAAQQQGRSEHPCEGWSIAGLFRGLVHGELYERLIEPQRQQHLADRQAWADLTQGVLAGDEHAKEDINTPVLRFR